MYLIYNSSIFFLYNHVYSSLDFLGKYYFYIHSLLIVILLIRLLSHNPQGVLC